MERKSRYTVLAWNIKTSEVVYTHHTESGQIACNLADEQRVPGKIQSKVVENGYGDHTSDYYTPG
jgi:hypothetical protein